MVNAEGLEILQRKTVTVEVESAGCCRLNYKLLTQETRNFIKTFASVVGSRSWIPECLYSDLINQNATSQCHLPVTHSPLSTAMTGAELDRASVMRLHSPCGDVTGPMGWSPEPYIHNRLKIPDFRVSINCRPSSLLEVPRGCLFIPKQVCIMRTCGTLTCTTT